MGQKLLATEPDGQSLIPGIPRGRKERTSSHMLSYEFHVHVVVHAPHLKCTQKPLHYSFIEQRKSKKQVLESATRICPGLSEHIFLHLLCL